MAKSKSEFALGKIAELIQSVIDRESIPKESQSYADLGWIKFYAKDLAAKCEGCAEAPHGDENDKEG